MDLQRRITEAQRRSSRKPLKCKFCGHELLAQHGEKHSEDSFRKHVESDHGDVLAETATDEERDALIHQLFRESAANHTREAGRTDPPREGPQQQSPTQPHPTAHPQSPGSSLKRGSGARSQSPPKRTRVRPTNTLREDVDDDFVPGPSRRGVLYDPSIDQQPQQQQLQQQQQRRSANATATASTQRIRFPPGSQPRTQRSLPQRSSHSGPGDDVDPPNTDMIREPETRPISQEQLVAEVKGIYAGLVMVEGKCIEVDNAQHAQATPLYTLNNEQYQALIALHRTLLHEHHDFFLASQHPSASPALRRLPSKYAMPARMWRHGIHSFLELLRHRLPASLEHMLTFIYLAYSMMALLYETVPAFEDTWIECLGDLGRYRMAIEDEDIRDREVWTQVSRHWYSRASDKAPTVGRLYHHLAILARPNVVQQLYFYSKSLCVASPFASARDSVMTLFDPILNGTSSTQHSRLPPVELDFVRCHAVLFSRTDRERLDTLGRQFIDSLDNYVGRTTRRFLETGAYTSITDSCAILGYGHDENPLMKLLWAEAATVLEDEDKESARNVSHEQQCQDALDFTNKVHDKVLRRFGDPNILSYLHTTFVFMHYVSAYPAAMDIVAAGFPWKLACLMFNNLLKSYQTPARIEDPQFPRVNTGPLPRPLPDDWAMRGLLFAEDYFPTDWFSDEKLDDNEKYFEVASMQDERRERALWLGCRISEKTGGKYIRYDADAHEFSVAPEYDVEISFNDGLDGDAMSISETETGLKDRDLGDLPDADEKL